jgi:two-component system, chemotaxis family, protein-glutamate methylesterase/glutaminase
MSALALPSAGPIRVLVADDSVFMRTALTRMIESDPGLKVVGTASHGLEALEKAASLDPDVVTLDIEMPRLDGLRTLGQMMQQSPRPVIMVSALSQKGAEAVLEAFDQGAFDCIGKPTTSNHLEIVRIREDLVAKVKAAAAAKWLRWRKPAPMPAPVRAADTVARGAPPQVIAIGSSTGGPKALQDIIGGLPGDLPAGVVIVQHMPVGFTGPFARRLDTLSRLTVREASGDDTVEPGVVLVAPAGRHLTVRRSGSRITTRLWDQAPNGIEARHTPSVDVMMLSVAEVYGSQAMGVLLTGMGADGANGMKKICDAGGYTVGQDEASCTVYGMPRAAALLGAVRRVLPLEEIGGEIAAACRAEVVAT